MPLALAVDQRGILPDRMIGALMRDGRVRRAFLGVVGGTRPLRPALAERLGRRRGLEVVQLLDNSPASAGGVRAGDVIVELDGRPIEGVGDLQRLMVGEVVGRPIGVEVERDGSMLALRVTPAELA